MPRDIVAIIGSLRKESFTRKVVEALTSLAPANLRIEIVEIRQLPLYDQDLDATPPQAWTAFRDRIRRADAVLFATPEYNRSVPGPLKNAIDVGSRPYGHSAWAHKPAAVISVTPGPFGAFGANHHLRQSLVFLDMPAMQQPEAYINNAAALFGPDGQLIDDRARTFLTNFAKAFEAWIEQVGVGTAA